MNKLRKTMGYVLMTALMATSFIGAKQTTVKADGDVNIRFHYTSSDGFYDKEKWSLTVISENKDENYLFFDEKGVTTETYATSDNSVQCYVKDVAKSKENADNGGSGFIRDDGSDTKLIDVDLSGKTGDVDVYLTFDSNEAKFEGTAASADTGKDETEASADTNKDETEAPADTNGEASGSEVPTVEETTTSSKDNDVSATSVVISDVVLLVAIAAGTFLALGREKKPII